MILNRADGIRVATATPAENEVLTPSPLTYASFLLKACGSETSERARASTLHPSFPSLTVYKQHFYGSGCVNFDLFMILEKKKDGVGGSLPLATSAFVHENVRPRTLIGQLVLHLALGLSVFSAVTTQMQYVNDAAADFRGSSGYPPVQPTVRCYMQFDYDNALYQYPCGDGGTIDLIDQHAREL
ncbi:hypothetical protein OUZ56_005529 [Daphnia magna]|uniref:Uncharacterized protein n=1 Tax=Daphnia magna TaxID=35525 RepID=A0ABQ9YT13_9CRUS|nr:hypothetical protein OUZ56_005529 [Daphnia magna]